MTRLGLSWGPDVLPLPHDDAIREHVYIVARGARPLAILGTIEALPMLMERVATRLATLSVEHAIPFVIDAGDGRAEVGYAATKWAIDLLRWVYTSGVPEPQNHRIIGLLLGYSPQAVRDYEEGCSGRLFAPPIESLGRASMSRIAGTPNRAETSPPCSRRSASDRCNSIDRFPTFDTCSRCEPCSSVPWTCVQVDAPSVLHLEKGSTREIVAKIRQCGDALPRPSGRGKRKMRNR